MQAPIPSSRLTLLTDFGTGDHYVAAMKGVISQIAPGAAVVDISHHVAPYQIRQGAYLLSQAWPWFPSRTVHVAVVDPGVGSERRALAVEADDQRFVLPDNGFLDLLRLKDPAVYHVQNRSLFLHPVSRTFHGRDIFAPVGAHLAAGLAIAEVGTRVENWKLFETSDLPAILHIDRFGNIITSLREMPRALVVRGVTIEQAATHYAEAPRATPFLMIGSGGFVEVSLREASAASFLGANIGDAVVVVVDP